MMRPRKGVLSTCLAIPTKWIEKVSVGDPHGKSCDMVNGILRISRANWTSGNMAGSVGLLPCRTSILSRCTAARRANLGSHSSRNSGVVLAHAPTTPECTVAPFLFRVILLERLQLPLPVTEAECSCGAPPRATQCGMHVLGSAEVKGNLHRADGGTYLPRGWRPGAL